MESLKRTRSQKHKKTLETRSGSKAGATGVIAPLNYGHNLVGDTGDVSPHFFRWGDIICHAPHFFLFRFFIWRRFKNKNVYHVLCEELFMLDGRPHIAELILNRVWYHWFRWFMNFSFDKLIFTIFQVSRERERCLTAFVRHSTLWYTVRKVIFL